MVSRWACCLAVVALAGCAYVTADQQEELRRALLHYEEVENSVAGYRDRSAVAQVATGTALEGWDVCRSCVVYVWIAGQFTEFEVLTYSENWSKVRVRVEWAWHRVDPDNGEVISPCVAQAYTTIAYLTRENGVWKFSGGEILELPERRLVDNTPALNAKYCTGR
ncbi:MAG: hypothetical protein HZB53_03615 [Chloroflexi bacterium]|nr:hypothetical protein [Chloroflexota bacterium]